MPYLVCQGRTVKEEFATPDAAYEYARRESKWGILIVRSGRGLDSSLRCFASGGKLYTAIICKTCKGSGRNDQGGPCYGGCYGDGAKAGAEVPS